MRGARLAAPFVALIAVTAIAIGPLAQFARANDPNVTLQDDETTAPPEVDQPEASQPDTVPPAVPEQTDDTGDAPADDTTTPDDTTATTTPAEVAPELPALPPDDDGVPADIENGAPNGGDGNGDGVADAEQANVASLPSKYDVDGNGALDDYVTIESPLFTSLANVRTLELPTDNPPPDGVSIPAGLIDYDVHVVTEGDAADVKLYLPDGTQSSVYMYQGGEWSNFDANSSVNDAANEVVLNLADGGAGDESGTNGVINDPVGVASPLAPPPPGNSLTFVVRNDNVPEPGVTFTYTLLACNNNSGTPGAVNTCTSVSTSPALADGVSHTFSNITVSGNQWFRVQREANASWVVGSLSCSGGTAQNIADTADRSGAVRLQAGSSGGACSFVNVQPGTVTLIKQTTPDGSPKVFTTTLRRCGENTDSGCDTSDTLVGPAQSVRDNDTATWTLTQGGRFWIDEGTIPGWTLSNRVCTGTTENGGGTPNPQNNGAGGINFYLGATWANQAVVCTFTNTQAQPGGPNSLTIRKSTVPGSNTPFTFTVRQCDGNTGSSTAPTNAQCSATGGTQGSSSVATYTITNGDFVTIVPLPDGNGDRWYRVEETIPTGWNSPVARSCTSQGDATPQTNSTASALWVKAGDGSPATNWVIDCTFTNTASSGGTGTITVRKGGTRNGTAGNGDTYANGLAGASFEYSADGFTWLPLPGCAPAGAVNCTSTAVAAGVYFVRESAAPGGWGVIPTLAYGGNSSGVNNQTRPYQGTVTVVPGQNAEVAVTINNGGTQQSPHRFVNFSPNNALPNTCGLSLSLILDESGSIGGDAPLYAASASAFIDALAGSPTTVYISSFSNNAAPAANSPFNLAINPGNATTGVNGAKAAITQIYDSVSGGTNWDEGLFESIPNATDLTVILTDGNPTTWGGSPNGGGGTITLNDLEAGIASANSVKAAGSKLIAVGVGPGVTASNLEVISGPGDFYTTNPAQLQATLAEIANQLCGSRVHVRKLVNGNPTNGWTFTGTSSAPGTSIAYPNGQVTGQGGNQPGQVQVNINNVPAPGGTNVTVTETLQGGFSFVGGTCNTGSFDGPLAGNASFNNGLLQATITGVQRNQDYYCTYNNAENPATIKVIKRLDGDATTAVPGWTINGQINNAPPNTARFAPGITTTDSKVTNNSNANPAQFDLVTVPSPGGSSVTLTEQLLPGYTPGAVNCTKNGGSVNSVVNGTVTLPAVLANDVWTCVFNNTTNKASIKVVKQVVGGGNGTFTFSLTGQPNSPALGNNGEHNFGNLTANQAYTIAELAPNTNGYTLTSRNCVLDQGSPGQANITNNPNGNQSTITPTGGQSYTCTYENTKQASIKVIKKVVGGGGGTFTFNLSGTGGGNSPALGNDGTHTWTPLATPAEYTISELNPNTGGYTLTNRVCVLDEGSLGPAGIFPNDNGNDVLITPTAGQSYTCTYTNTRQAKIVTKKVTNPASDNTTEFGFTPSWGAGFDLVGGGQNESVFLAPGGGYSVSENAPPAGWVLTGSSCDGGNTPANITLDAGEIVTCTFTNTKQAKIVTKKVTNPASDNTTEFGFTPSWGAGFDLVGGGQNESVFLAPGGGYSVSENAPPAGWVLTGSSCDGGNTPANITLDAGEIVTCTFTNTKQAKIVTKKVTNPASDNTTEFGFTPSWGAGFDLVGGGQNESVFLAPGGGYSVSENAPPAGWVLTGSSCDGGNTPANITLDAGEIVTCTFTNTKQAKIVTKKVTNPVSDNTTEFGFTPSWGAGFDLVGGGQNESVFLAPGGGYSVSENAPPAGWVLTGSSCDGGNTPANITLDAGEIVTCTFTNTKQAKIVTKKVTNPVSDNTTEFGFTPSWGAGFDLVGGGQNESVFLAPGGGYSVSENAPPAGWVLTGSSCDGGNTPANITLDAGEIVTCTFTNTKQAKIVTKKVTNPVSDNTTEFGFTPSWGAGFDLVGGGQNESVFLAPGGGYSVSENAPPAGWVLTGSSCDGGNTPANITLDAGEIVTCTFTNTQDARIIVEKVTDPVSDTTTEFTFNPSWSDDNFELTNGGVPHNSGVLVPGDYSVNEIDVPAGWTLNGATCVSSNQDTETAADISLQAGEVVTCTFTNTQDARIIVEKVTDPVSDTTTEFTFNPSWSDDNFELTNGGVPHNSGVLVPGDYSVNEIDVPAGWTLNGATCVSSNQDTETAADISLQAGEVVTCTFTNTQDARIIVEKVTDPVSDTTTEFTFNPSWSDDNFELTNGGVPHNSGVLVPGDYSVNEIDVPAGWTLNGATCVSSNQDTETAADISLQAGEVVTCTFTNTQDARIIVEKVTDPVSDTTTEFTFNPSWSDDNFELTNGGVPHNSGVLVPGDYSVNEIDVPAGWTLNGATCVSSNQDTETAADISLQAGEVVTCTFTNTQDARIIVEKVTDPVSDTTTEFTFNPSWSDDNFELTNGGVPHNSGVLVPGDYSVNEIDVPAGWTLNGATCVSSNQDTETAADISLQAGEVVTCTFTNTQDARIIVEKVTDPVSDTTTEFTFNPSWSDDNFELTNGGVPHNSGVLVPGDYSVNEIDVPAGWTLNGATCVSSNQDTETAADISLQAGEVVTCTFNNSLNTATVTVIKNIGESDEAVAGWDINASVPGAGSGRFTEIDPNENPIVAPNGETATGVTTGEGDPPALLFTLDHVAAGGTTVTLTETLQEQFSFGGFSCAGGGAVNTVGRGGTVVVTNGQNVTCTFVNNPAGIGLTKDADPTQLEVGDQTTFTLTATNTADVPLTNIIFTDPLDPRFVFVSSPDDHLPAGPDCTAVGQDVTCGPFAGPLAPTEQFVVEFTVQVVAPAAVGDVIPNEAHVSALPPDGPEVVADAPIDVNIIEVLATATISVRKVTTGSNPAAPGPFPVTVRSGSAPFDETAQLATGGSSETFIVPEGDGYGVTEAVPAGWTLASIECVRVGGSNVDPAGFSAPGGSVTDCVVTNDPGEVGGITVLPFTGSAGEMLLKTALWLLAIGGLALLGSRLWRRRELTA